jgi:tRNA pseudouridine13 synthase
MRSVPEDFVVREWPLAEASGDGEHLLVLLRKRGWTTPAAAGQLARAFGVANGRVSYAGMKDRHAVTEQWLSIHVPGRGVPEPAALPPGLELLQIRRHHRKLRRGALRGNRFELRLRGVTATPKALHRRLLAVAHRGVPNYFGSQRFGRDGDNTTRALAWFRGEVSVANRRERGFLLSAARSAVFNAVLAERVAQDSWDQPVAGDRLMLDGRRSLFSASSEDGAVLAARMARSAVHATGPLPGKPGQLPGDEPLPEVERRVLADHESLVAGLRAADVVADRRALRVPVRALAWSLGGDGQLRLRFDLPPGAYATTVLDQVLRLEDGSLT